MATLHVSPPSETHTHTTAGLFSPVTHGYAGSSTRTYSESTQSPPTSPLNYKSPALLNLPPATDTLINTGLESQPSLTARLHRRKKTYKPPTAPPIHASQPHDPLRAARLAWRLQEEYAEQLRVEEEQMRQSSSSFQRQQQKEFVRQTAPAQSNRHKRKAVRSKWQAFWLWFSLGFYRFTRRVKSVFKWVSIEKSSILSAHLSISLSIPSVFARILRLVGFVGCHLPYDITFIACHTTLSWKHTYRPPGRTTTYIPSGSADLHIHMHISSLPSVDIANFSFTSSSSSTSHHRISFIRRRKARACSSNQLYSYRIFANIVIQYIAWGFLTVSVGFVYIRYVSISSSAGLQITALRCS